jgi:hypothetical protein
VILAQVAAFPAHAADGAVDLVHVVVGVGEDEPCFRGISLRVGSPLPNQRGLRLFLRAGPLIPPFES